MSTQERAADLDLSSDSSPEVANGHVRCIEGLLTPFLAVISILVAINIFKYHKDLSYGKKERYVWSVVICLCGSAVGFTIVLKNKVHTFVAAVSHISYAFALATVGALVLLVVPSQIGFVVISISCMLLMFFTCNIFQPFVSSVFPNLSPQASAADNPGQAANVQPRNIPSFNSVVSSASFTDDTSIFDLESFWSNG